MDVSRQADIPSSLIEWAKKLISCPSVTDAGTRRIVELCARELLGSAGISARVLPSARYGEDQVNLLAVVEAKDSPSRAPLVLNTHLDTVPPGDPALWTACDGDPFNPVVRDGKIYGLGAADTKLDFAAKALALALTPKPSRTVYLVGTFGEESGLRGAKELVDSGALPAGALAFVGEPSSLTLILGHRGMNVFRLTVSGEPQAASRTLRPWRAAFFGVSAHSSTPDLGRNAIEMALRALEARPQLSVAKLSGGDAVNKVPARCEVIVLADSSEQLGVESSDCLVEQDDELEIAPEVIAPSIIKVLAEFLGALKEYASGRKSAIEGFSRNGSITSNVGIIEGQAGKVSLTFEVRQPPDFSAEIITRELEGIVERLEARFPKLRLELQKLRANPGFYTPEQGETVALGFEAMVRSGLELRTGVKLGCTEAGVYASAGMKPVVFGPGPSTGVIHAPNEYNFVDELEKAFRFYQNLLLL